ncbi:MAG TPA: DUF2132 domain-containing protein [Rheinheimera sp.]|uniref:VF530 family DNA-binding protein n=1 Tax=Rheinheimera sp. TaxID=1869214 RepID=UPI000EF0F25D|nr:DUF2132 domain-containing protein [Rheinheimera sp.]
MTTSHHNTAHNNTAQPQGAATTAVGAAKAAQPKNPLHGFTLEQILNLLLAHYGGYPALARQVKLKCFSENPSLKSSLNFLRKTTWARTEVEQLFIRLGLYQHKS